MQSQDINQRQDTMSQEEASEGVVGKFSVIYSQYQSVDSLNLNLIGKCVDFD